MMRTVIVTLVLVERPGTWILPSTWLPGNKALLVGRLSTSRKYLLKEIALAQDYQGI